LVSVACRGAGAAASRRRFAPAIAALEIKVGSAAAGLVDAFRDAPVLCALRDPARLAGKCRLCEYVRECGGSRTRAWAFTGDWLAPDPACGYQPQPARGDSAPGAAAEAAPNRQAPARRW
jgi:hypothetical protein